MKKLKKLACALGVGQERRGSYWLLDGTVLKIIRNHCFFWKGFVLIQRVFIKPARFMEDMTYDMAGSATVVGLIKMIRKAKVNAVGVVGRRKYGW